MNEFFLIFQNERHNVCGNYFGDEKGKEEYFLNEANLKKKKNVKSMMEVMKKFHFHLHFDQLLL
jgi:hypothetical protein